MYDKKRCCKDPGVLAVRAGDCHCIILAINGTSAHGSFGVVGALLIIELEGDDNFRGFPPDLDGLD